MSGAVLYQGPSNFDGKPIVVIAVWSSKNSKTGEREPVLTVKTSRSNTYAHEVRIDGPCVIKYSPDRPLSCGAKVWIETENDVIIIR